MSIDISAEIKFSHVSKGEYLVRLQDADQTIIGKLLAADGGWKSYAFAPDGSWKGSFCAFGTTRYQASRSLLESYELANGLRDPKGRRVTKEQLTGLWYVANHYGGRESSRWADKAEAIAKLASLQPTDFEQIGRQAARDDKPAAPSSNPEVRFALAGRTVGDPENMRIMQAFTRGYDAERTAQADEAMHDMPAVEDKTGNEYAAEAYIADQAGDMAAALWAVLQAWRVEPGQADRWRKLLRTYRGLPAVPSGTRLDDRGDVQVEAAETNALAQGYADARRHYGDEYADHIMAHDAELAAKGLALTPWPASLSGNDGN